MLKNSLVLYAINEISLCLSKHRKLYEIETSGTCCWGKEAIALAPPADVFGAVAIYFSVPLADVST